MAKTPAIRLYLTEGEANILHSIWKHQEDNGGRGATGEQIAAYLLTTHEKVTLIPAMAGLELEAFRKQLQRKLSLTRKYISELSAKGDYIATLGWSTDASGKRSKLYGLQELVMIRRPCTARTVLALTAYCAQKRESHVSIREFRQHLENPPLETKSEKKPETPMLAKQVKEDIAYAIATKYFLVYQEAYIGPAKRIELERPFLTRLAAESSSPMSEIAPLEMTKQRAGLLMAIWHEERANGGNSVSISKLKERTEFSEISIRNQLAELREEWPWRMLDLVSGGQYKLANPTSSKEGVVGFPETALILLHYHLVTREDRDRVSRNELLNYFGPGTTYNLEPEWIEDSVRYAIQNFYLVEVDGEKNLWTSARLEAERPYLELVAEQPIRRIRKQRPVETDSKILDENGQPRIDVTRPFPILSEDASRVLYALARAELQPNREQLDLDEIKAIIDHPDDPAAGSKDFLRRQDLVKNSRGGISKMAIKQALKTLENYPIAILHRGPEKTYSLMVDTLVSWPCGAHTLMQLTTKLGRGNLVPYSNLKRGVPERHYRTGTEVDDTDDFHDLDLDIEYLIRTRYLEARDVRELPMPYTRDFPTGEIKFLCVPSAHNRFTSEALYLEMLAKQFRIGKP